MTEEDVRQITEVAKDILKANGDVFSNHILAYISFLEKENAELKAQIEKMKNFYNCSHSSRALCPNEHKCNGCKDWELAE